MTLKSSLEIAQERLKNYSSILKTVQEKEIIISENNSKIFFYKGKFEQSEVLTKEISKQNSSLKLENKNLYEKLISLEKISDNLKQKEKFLLEEKVSWKKEKENILYQLSSEILKKNTEEQTKFRENQKDILKDVTGNLISNFQSVLEKVNILDNQVKKSTSDIELTKNALLTPAGAGRTAEITLENILKSSGLQEKRDVLDIGDFIIQSSFTTNDNIKRPDALIFLPKNHMLIIDSKSSSHFMNLQIAIDKKDNKLQKDLSLKIRDSMKKHIEDLKKRNYAEEKFKSMKLNNLLSDNVPVITTIMFIQTEKILETIRYFDSEIELYALKYNIQILSPAGLVNLLSNAKFYIDRFKQEKNIEKLKTEVEKIVNSLEMIFYRSKEMGDMINKTVNSYNKLVGTFNKRFIPRVSTINNLGIKNNIYKLDKIETKES